MAPKPEFPVDVTVAKSRDAERRDICHQISILARRAEAASMPFTAYLLNMVLVDEIDSRSPQPARSFGDD